MVVQHYVDDPLLLDRCKFDLRLYVLVRSLSPLKIYLYEEGLSRLATCDYEKPNSSNQKNMWMHLTNYAINKTSPNFIFNKDGSEDHLGHKRSLSATMKLLQNLGCDCQQLQAQIDHIIVKTIVSAQPILLKKYREIREVKEEMESVCFEILGFDILIREDFTPLLLEVNHSPSFAAETPLDLIIKKHLLLDTLNLLNLNPEDKIHYFKSRN
jgi:tubulin polyglutamylase TTLL6/13